MTPASPYSFTCFATATASSKVVNSVIASLQLMETPTLIL
eukprot:CAMPEP_0204916750 /NCGR_PEP_ID=MMETSP1397-20131031/14497_1 /ASSEMBLY_ACC=CAM_ASM_000891 /TAXON_ID=49980 /ORGANISM="Climacostomum Climacostomum virens, Strain Stock W-24" /LENGTH=39 /DNA_ID= /DNA_START= /DNA_END= /DNA_ORIENTATION=